MPACDVTPETYPDIGCILTTDYTPTLISPKRYLGGRDAFSKRSAITFTLVLTVDEQKLFYIWWKDKLNHGLIPFYITLPLFEVMTPMTVVLINPLSPTILDNVDECELKLTVKILKM